MITPHRIPEDQFTALAAGGGGTAAIRTLERAQLSKHLLLIKFITEAWPPSTAGRDDALAVLTAAQSRAPATVRRLLGDPRVGAWAAYTTRRMRGSVPHEAPVRADVGHLGAVAVAAAVGTGAEAEVVAYPRDGWLAVPTLGCVRMPVPDHTPVRVRVRDGQLHVTGDGIQVTVRPGGEGWRGVHRLGARTGAGTFRVALDDLDPYRGGHHVLPAPRLRDEDVRRWQESFTRAWRLLSRYAPDLATGVGAGLRCLVPLTDGGPGTALSATVRDAFGAFGLTLPASPAELAVTIVHEFQHSKLSAVLDLVNLYHTGEETYFAPWRADPRPVGGLFQGVYAFLGVADTWRRLLADPGLRPVAEYQFAHAREQVHRALTTLVASGRLTPAGDRFAAGMRCSLEAMLTERVPPPVAGAARDALTRDHGAWRRRHSRVS